MRSNATFYKNERQNIIVKKKIKDLRRVVFLCYSLPRESKSYLWRIMQTCGEDLPSLLSSRSREGLIVKKRGAEQLSHKNTGLVLIWIQWPGITGPRRALVSNGICDREQRMGINMLHLTCGHNTSPSHHLDQNNLIFNY